MAGKIDLYEDRWIDIVFANKNKEYGAYQVRKNYARNIMLGIIFAIVFFTLAVSAPLIVRLLTNTLDELNKKKVVNTEVTLAEPPPVDEKTPPPPPAPPPPPLRSTIKFTPPVIKPDEEVDEPPPTQEQLKEVDAGTKTVEGDPNADVDLSGLEGDGTGDVLEEPDQVFISVEQMPEYPGGEGALLKEIASKIKYPAIARENNIEGTVYMSFVVNKEGVVTNVKVLRGIGGGCDEEATRVIKSLSKFTPGKQNGRAVQVQYNVPVRFKLM
jgi:periplasmic protein TonB